MYRGTRVLRRIRQRQVHPWLAEKLDQIYQTGSAVTSLARGNGKPPEGQAAEAPRSDVFVVQLPRGGPTLPLYRREVMASLSLGIVNGELQTEFERAVGSIEPDSDILQLFDASYQFLKGAAHTLPPAQLIQGITGDIAVLDQLRRRAVGADRHRWGILQARYATLLSWMSQEADDALSTLWWNDRAMHWAQAAGWSGMIAASFIRRSAMVHQFSGDGFRVVEEARPVLEIPQASPQMKGLAAGQIAYGYALAGRQDDSYRALEMAMNWLSQPLREDDTILCQRTVPDDDHFALYQKTCDIYLGYGARAIPGLEPLPESFAGISFRMTTVTRVKLAWAYANAGQPDKACRVAWKALDAVEQVGSQLARTELRRALPVLNRWHGRSDVRDVVHRLQN